MKLTKLDCTTPISCHPRGKTSYHCTFPITEKITSNGKKAEKVAMIKAQSTILWSVNPLRNVQQVISSLSVVESDAQSDVLD